MIDPRKTIADVAAIIVTGLLLSGAGMAMERPGADAEPKVEVQTVRVEPDVMEGGQKGFRVKASFTMYGMRGKNAVLLVRVVDTEGEGLPGDGGRYDVDGILGVKTPLRPVRDPEVIKDMAVFMPYAALESIDAIEDLGVDVDVMSPNGELIGHLDLVALEVGDEPGSPTVEVEFSDLKIARDVVREGRAGVLVTLKLPVVRGLKGVSCFVAVNVLEMSDEPVLAVTDAYASESGNLMGRYALKPAHDPAKFDAVEIFIPNSEFSVAIGTRVLKFDIDITSDAEELIKHLTTKEVEFVKQRRWRSGSEG